MKTNKLGEEVVPCDICGMDTTMLGTKLCDPCWELKRRVEREPKRYWLVVQYLEDRNGIC